MIHDIEYHVIDDVIIIPLIQYAHTTSTLRATPSEPCYLPISVAVSQAVGMITTNLCVRMSWTRI